MSDETPAETPAAPVDLEVLAENVRSRLHAHGQHGALAEFAKYTTAVGERLAEAKDGIGYGVIGIDPAKSGGDRAVEVTADGGTIVDVKVAGRRAGKKTAAAKATK